MIVMILEKVDFGVEGVWWFQEYSKWKLDLPLKIAVFNAIMMWISPICTHTQHHIRTYQLKRGAVGANATAVAAEQPLLPLWGQLCCNLMAQPECATNARITGFINIQVSGDSD